MEPSEAGEGGFPVMAVIIAAGAWALITAVAIAAYCYCKKKKKPPGSRPAPTTPQPRSRPAPTTPQRANTNIPQPQSQIASSSTTSAATDPVQVAVGIPSTSTAAYPAQVPTMGASNVSSEMRITFPPGEVLGVYFLQKDGKVVVDEVQPTSAAAAVPIGATIQDVSGLSCEGKGMKEVMSMIAKAKMTANAER